MYRIDITSFGTTSSGRQAFLYTLENHSGMKLKVTNYGATIVSILIPKSNGGYKDIVLGFDSVSGYEKTKYYLGATIGRYAGQIRNARFDLNGRIYSLYVNDHFNTLHGGRKGFDKQFYQPCLLEEENMIEFQYFSKDGEEGFPGNLNVISSYQLTEDNEIIMKHMGQSDENTILNMTNHSYYNLDGHEGGSVENHRLTIYGDEFLEVAEDCCPNGTILSVKNTPMDFTSGRRIGERIEENYKQLTICGGYDHNWNINNYNKELRKCAELESTEQDIRMQMLSDLPGLQMYSGNYLDGKEAGKNNFPYDFRGALCLEPQFYPAAPCYPQFPSPVLSKGQKYDHTIKLKFYFQEVLNTCTKSVDY